jgi:hypothetical protein
MDGLLSESVVKWWLLAVAGFRIFSVVLGHVFPGKLQQGLFRGPATAKLDAARDIPFNLAARQFAAWTLTTCLLCVVAAFNLDSAPMVVATGFTFVIALAVFAVELQHGTVTPTSIAAPFLIASEHPWARVVVEGGGGGGVGHRGFGAMCARPRAALRCGQWHHDVHPPFFPSGARRSAALPLDSLPCGTPLATHAAWDPTSHTLASHSWICCTPTQRANPPVHQILPRSHSPPPHACGVEACQDTLLPSVSARHPTPPVTPHPPPLPPASRAGTSSALMFTWLALRHPAWVPAALGQLFVVQRRPHAV